MKRQVVFLTEQQLAWLHGEAARIGINPSEYMRRVVDYARLGRESETSTLHYPPTPEYNRTIAEGS